MIELLFQADRALGGGALDQAEHTYQRLARLNPTSAIAVVGLAQVCLARGDNRMARTLADRALLLDPDSAAAKRVLRQLDQPGVPVEAERLEADATLLAAERLEAFSRRFTASVKNRATRTAMGAPGPPIEPPAAAGGVTEAEVTAAERGGSGLAGLADAGVDAVLGLAAAMLGDALICLGVAQTGDGERVYDRGCGAEVIGRLRTLAGEIEEALRDAGLPGLRRCCAADLAGSASLVVARSDDKIIALVARTEHGEMGFLVTAVLPILIEALAGARSQDIDPVE
jgi:tetratricopeptide (TPR) repeat protein